jgi:hypothetical protein
MRDVHITKIIAILLGCVLMSLSTGCARLVVHQPMAFWGSPVGAGDDRSTATFSFSGGGTIGVSGGLLIDQFEKNHWAQLN